MTTEYKASENAWMEHEDVILNLCTPEPEASTALDSKSKALTGPQSEGGVHHLPQNKQNDDTGSEDGDLGCTCSELEQNDNWASLCATCRKNANFL